MKKKIILAVILTSLLTGCNSGKKLECTHKDENDNMGVITTQKFVFDKDGKKIKEASTKIEYTFKDKYVNYLKENNLDIKDVVDTDSICDSYKSMKSASCKSSTKDNKITIETKIKTSKEEKLYDGDYKFFKEYYEEMKYECK